MSRPARIDLYRTRGDTYPEDFTFLNGNGAAQSITGCTFRLSVDTLQNPPNSSTNITTIAGSILVAAAGTFRFIPNATLIALAIGEYWFDVEMTDANGYVWTIIKGRYVVEQDISK